MGGRSAAERCGRSFGDFAAIGLGEEPRMLAGTGRVLPGFAACQGGVIRGKGDPCQGRVLPPFR